MSKIKGFTIILLIAMLAALPVSKALAASSNDTTNGTGTIVSIKIDSDLTTGISTVLVSLLDSNSQAQTIRISLVSAISKGLVIPNEGLVGQVIDIIDPTDGITFIASGLINSLNFLTDETLTVNLTDASDVTSDFNLDLKTAVFNDLVITNDLMIGTDFDIDPLLVLDSSVFGKVVSKLGAFFTSKLGVDFATLEALKADGFGYGVITQASWMATLLEGDADLLAQILEAKRSGNYDDFQLEDGSTPTSWGQLRNALLTEKQQNLGQIMSGKADLGTTSSETTTENDTSNTKSDNGNGNSNEKSNNGKSNADNHGNSNKNKP